MRHHHIYLMLILLLLLSACHAAEPPAVENVGPNTAITTVSIDDFTTLCSWSNTIVRATYEGCDDFTSGTSVFRFQVERDYIGNCTEAIVHVYESNFSSFIPGKTYYLFLSGYRNSLYPHVVYSRVHPEFLLGQTDKGYTFYQNFQMDVGTVTDFNSYIQEEIINNGTYADDSRLQTESLESAYENADRILLIEITAAKDYNPNVASCSYQTLEVLKDTAASVGSSAQQEPISDELRAVSGISTTLQPNTPAPAGTQVGDQFILLLQYVEETDSYDLYPRGMFLFPVNSASGVSLLAMAQVPATE